MKNLSTIKFQIPIFFNFQNFPWKRKFVKIPAFSLSRIENNQNFNHSDAFPPPASNNNREK